MNDKTIGEQEPDHGPNTFYGVPDKGGNPFDGGNCRYLKHPPFTFSDVTFVSGELKADGADAVFVHASVIDGNGKVSCLDNTTEVEFSVSGDAKILESPIVRVRGGVASILLQINSLNPGKIKISAKSEGLKDGVLILHSK